MWPAAKKYQTRCLVNETNSVISEHEFEAINRNEAEARAYLNCVKENNNRRDIHVEVR